jgi:nicotinamide-nucleotide amidase
LPSPGIVKLRISSIGRTDEENHERVVRYKKELYHLVPEYIYGENKEELAEIVGELLMKNGKTVGACESCTGGYLSHLFTINSGSSRYYNGSVIAYTNHLKNKILNVSNETLEKHGAVSEEVVKEMVLGGVDILEVDYAIALSGVAGPTGGTDQKPVGMVCIAVGNKEEVKTFTFNFANNRERNISMSAIYALNELRKLISKQ